MVGGEKLLKTYSIYRVVSVVSDRNGALAEMILSFNIWFEAIPGLGTCSAIAMEIYEQTPEATFVFYFLFSLTWAGG